jgi:hypothetical protein
MLCHSARKNGGCEWRVSVEESAVLQVDPAVAVDQLGNWTVTIPVEDWAGTYVFSPMRCLDGNGTACLRLARCCALIDASNLTFKPDHRAWARAEHAENRWQARQALYYQAGPARGLDADPLGAEGFWWMPFDDITYPATPPDLKGYGTSRLLARVAECHEQCRLEPHGTRARCRSEALERLLGTLSRRSEREWVERARARGLLPPIGDGDLVTERGRYLLDLDAMHLSPIAAEAFVLSTDGEWELAERHRLSAERVAYVRSRGAELVRAGTGPNELIARALELRPDTVRRIRAGEAGAKPVPSQVAPAPSATPLPRDR